MLIDMPLEELSVYQGRNPRPADFEQYWDNALQQMRSIDPKVELIEAKFHAPCAQCFDMYFTGVGGACIHAKLMRPKVMPAKPQPAVVIFHGYSGNSGDWHDKLGYVAAGFTVAALDVRGQGGLSEDVGGHVGNTLNGHIIRGIDGNPEDLLFRQIYLDCAQLTYLVMGMEGVDPKRVGAFGGSQGGGLTLACASLVPELNRAAPAFPFLCDYLRVWEMDLAKDAYAEIKQYFRSFDPRHERRDDIFERLGYVDVQFLAPRIKAKILMFTALMDTVCPPSSQFAAYNKIKSPKEVRFYPDFGHEWLPEANDMTYEYMMEMLGE